MSIRADILAGLRAAEDSAVDDLAPESLLDAFERESVAPLAAEIAHLRAAIDEAVKALDHGVQMESAPSTRARMQAIANRLHEAARTEAGS